MKNPWKAWMVRMPKRPFWVFLCASQLFTLGFSAYFFLFNLYLVELHYVEASIGRIVAAMSVGTLVATLPMGILARRFGLRRVLLIAGPVTAAICAARAISPSYPSQLVLAFLAGAALCSWGVCISPSIARLTDETTRPFGFSVLFGTSIGMAGVGSLIAGRLPALLMTWSSNDSHALSSLASKQATLILACITAVLAIVPISMLHLGAAEKSGPLLRKPHPFLLRFLPAIALWSFVTSAFAPFATVYFTRQFDIPLVRMSTIFSIAQAVQCAAVLLAPLTLRLFGLGNSVMGSQLIAACGLVVLAGTHTPTQAVWFYWGYIAMNYMSEPALFSLLMDRVPPEERSSASSTHMLVAALVQSCAAAITGNSITRFGYRAVFAALALCTCASAILFRHIAATADDARINAPGAIDTESQIVQSA